MALEEVYAEEEAGIEARNLAKAQKKPRRSLDVANNGAPQPFRNQRGTTYLVCCGGVSWGIVLCAKRRHSQVCI